MRGLPAAGALAGQEDFVKKTCLSRQRLDDRGKRGGFVRGMIYTVSG